MAEQPRVYVYDCCGLTKTSLHSNSRARVMVYRVFQLILRHNNILIGVNMLLQIGFQAIFMAAAAALLIANIYNYLLT